MASSQQIEKNIMADIKGLLDADGISDVIDADSERPETATFVKVGIINMRSNLAGGSVPVGMRMADVMVDCFSYFDDDLDGTDLNSLAGDVRSVIYDSDIVSELNTQSTYNTYLAMLAGDDLPDEDGRYRIKSIQFSLIMRPEKETS